MLINSKAELMDSRLQIAGMTPSRQMTRAVTIIHPKSVGCQRYHAHSGKSKVDFGSAQSWDKIPIGTGPNNRTGWLKSLSALPGRGSRIFKAPGGYPQYFCLPANPWLLLPLNYFWLRLASPHVWPFQPPWSTVSCIRLPEKNLPGHPAYKS